MQKGWKLIIKMARNWKNSSDGLIGLWGHSFDERGDIDTQFEIIRRSGDVYIVRIYSLADGSPSGVRAISRQRLLGLKLYETCEDMNEALDMHNQARRWQWQSVEHAGGRLQ